MPLVGPSSIILAVMASGLNGQSFAFNGYLPVKPPERAKAIRFFERRALSEGQSQLFIEAPLPQREGSSGNCSGHSGRRRVLRWPSI